MKETHKKDSFLTHDMSIRSDFEYLPLNEDFYLLEEKKTITTATMSPSWNKEKTTNISDLNEIIQDIPYYNAELGKDKTVIFEWYPKQEDYNKVFKDIKSRNPKYLTSDQIWQSIFKLDILGLRSGGAALFENYYEDKKKYYDDDEDQYKM